MRKRQIEHPAVIRLRNKAKGGNPHAQCMLGAVYASGEFGVPVNRARAMKWYQTAAQEGHAEAQYNLGIMYLRGECVKKNKRKGIDWLQKAAETNYTDAQELLGAIYEFGTFGFDRNEKQAVEWYRRAAINGNAKAEYSLGLMYLDGKGVAQIETKGLAWIRKAAQHGYAEAKDFLHTRRRKTKRRKSLRPPR